MSELIINGALAYLFLGVITSFVINTFNPIIYWDRGHWFRENLRIVLTWPLYVLSWIIWMMKQ